jgi:hypothetical protein
MLDDIDYSDLTPAQPKAAPASESKKKSNIADRSVVKPSEKSGRKQVDVGGLTEKAAQIQADVGAPEIPDPLAQYGLPALGALGALGTAYGVYKSLQNKNPPPPPPPPPPSASGPDYSAYNSPAYLRNAPVPPDAPVVSAPTAASVPPSLPQQTNLTPEDIQARAAQLKALEPVNTPITAAPVDAPAPTPSAQPNSPVTSIVTDTVKEMIQETPAQPTDITKPVAAAAPTPVAPPVYPKAGTKFKTEADIPPGFVARYDVGNVDRSMGNILGLEHRAHARDLFNKGLPFGQSADQNKAVSDLTKQYFQQLQSEVPETILSRDARQAQKIPSEFGVFAKNTNFGTGVKIGGRAATLFALSDVANAQTAAERGMAGANLLEAVLPPGLAIAGAGEGSGATPSASQAMLLGSPYAQSPLAVKQRQALEYERKVGAGRGIAPPSAYQR